MMNIFSFWNNKKVEDTTNDVSLPTDNMDIDSPPKVSYMDTLMSGKDPSSIESHTFTFDDVEEEKIDMNAEYGVPTYTTFKEYVTNNSKIMNTGDKIVFASEKNNTFESPLDHGLLGTIFTAYSKHVPLTLKPDNLLVAIQVAFGRYVCDHSEELKHLFVDHEGRKELEVLSASGAFEDTTDVFLSGLIDSMKEKMSKNVKNDLVEWFSPKFTTTTKLDDVISTITLMNSMKEYFAYKMTLGCGLSKVTLEGTVDDWIRLVEKAKHLYTFKNNTLSKWADLLVPVLQQFVEARRGNVNEDFWQRICTSERRGSGSQQTYRGWFLVFAPFDDESNYMLRNKSSVDLDHIYGKVDDNDIVDCYVNVPVKINSNGTIYNTTFNASMTMTHYDEENNMLRPNANWCLIVNSDITYEDIIDHLEDKKIKTPSWRIRKDMELILLDDLMKFVYFAIQLFNFPMDSYIDAADRVFCYYHFNRYDSGHVYKSISTCTTLQEIYYNVLEFMNCEHEGRDLSKYMQPSKFNDIVTKYQSLE